MEQAAWDRLIEVYDPELGIDLVNLGLVYELGSDHGTLTVAMTLTTPGCPMGGSIPDQVKSTLETVPGVREVQVDLIWEPRWEPEMMSDHAKHALGWQ
ncbi:MAG: metal-sulfur cluster assembly factor [Candidatus Dormibacteria bacterium]